MTSPSLVTETDEEWSGWIYALSAFGWWGFVFPCLLIWLNNAAQPWVDSRVVWSFEVLAHRVLWCALCCLGLLFISRNWSRFTKVGRSRTLLLSLLASSILIAANWFGFIVATAIDRLNEASLGYYINPLLNVLLGYLLLGETLRRRQWIAVVLAGGGVAWLILIHGEVPWFALLIAGSFGFYGLIRKQLGIEALVGLTYEVLFCLPLIGAYLCYRQAWGPGLVFGQSELTVSLLLMACGPVTAAPLLWFAAAARRLPLSTVGFIQFLTPTGQLLIAIFVNGESLPPIKLIGFLFIWVAIAIYLWDSVSVKWGEAGRRASI